MIMQKIKIMNGHYIFKLDDLLEKRNISINKLSRDTNTDFSVIKRYLDPNSYSTVRLDLFVLTRFCNYFSCELSDIVEYINKKN